MTKKVLFVEDGSVDVDELEKMDLGVDNIIIYRQGSKRPEFVDMETPETKGGEFTEKAICYAVAKAITASAKCVTEYKTIDNCLETTWRINNIDACVDRVISILRGENPDADE